VVGPRDRRIAQIAEAQRGRVARRQLLAAGISSSTIGWQLDRCRLFAVHRGVYAVGHTGAPPLGDETAALLAAGDSAALSHLSAAALWGMTAPALGGDVIDIIAGADRRPSLRGVTVHRSRCLVAKDIRIRHGLPVTSPARTSLDIAELLPRRQMELAFDRAIVDKHMRHADVEELLGRTAGRRGGPILAELLARHGHPTMTRSEAEERMLALIRAADLPEPAVNARVRGYEVDFLWRQQCFAVEVDGFRFHSTRAAFERDRRKDADLRRAGVDTMRVTWRQLEEEPYALVARIAEALARPHRLA
jgi:very-short-patch-repair endonuclease